MRDPRQMGPLGGFGIANSLVKTPDYAGLLDPVTGEPMEGGGGGGGFSMGFGGQQRINQGFAEKDYVGFDDHYTGAGRRGAGSYGFGGGNHNVEAYKQLNPVAQKEFTNNYMKDNRYSNVKMGSKWNKPAAPLASRVVVGGRGRGGRGGVTRVARTTPTNSYANYSRRVGGR